jgi:hypothetical protein
MKFYFEHLKPKTSPQAPKCAKTPEYNLRLGDSSRRKNAPSVNFDFEPLNSKRTRSASKIFKIPLVKFWVWAKITAKAAWSNQGSETKQRVKAPAIKFDFKYLKPKCPTGPQNGQKGRSKVWIWETPQKLKYPQSNIWFWPLNLKRPQGPQNGQYPRSKIWVWPKYGQKPQGQITVRDLNDG